MCLKNSYAFIFLISSLTVACSHFEKVDENKLFLLQVKPSPNKREIFKIKSTTKTHFFEKSYRVRDKEQEVVFQYETLDQSTDDKAIKLKTSVTEKDGYIDLHDMAYPELNEELKVSYNLQGHVLFVEGQPRNSLWYLPYIPLPREPVKIGDTWAFKKVWLTNSEIPLKIDLLVILKDVFKKEGVHYVDLELAGEISVDPATKIYNMQLGSKLKGRVLFHFEKGSLLWSWMVNEESVTVQNSRVDSESCSLTQQMSPFKGLKLLDLDKTPCWELVPPKEMLLK